VGVSQAVTGLVEPLILKQLLKSKSKIIETGSYYGKQQVFHKILNKKEASIFSCFYIFVLSLLVLSSLILFFSKGPSSIFFLEKLVDKN